MDNDTIKKLSHLSKLTIPDDDIEELKTNLKNILNLISDIDAAPTEDMAPMAHPLDFSQPLRDDKSDDAINRTENQNDNPFKWNQVRQNIVLGLEKEGFTEGKEYVIMQVPNIVDISYGRGVGYTFTQHDLGEEIHNISATKIRAKLREEGKLD